MLSSSSALDWKIPNHKARWHFQVSCNVVNFPLASVSVALFTAVWDLFLCPSILGGQQISLVLDSCNRKQPCTSPFQLRISFTGLGGICFGSLIKSSLCLSICQSMVPIFLAAALKHNLVPNTCFLIEVQSDLLANVSGSIAFVSIRFTKSCFGPLPC